jgi:hypothetical protein
MKFTALGVCNIGCVKFLGITSFPMNEFESVEPLSHLSNYEDEPFLVFEKASKGSLPNFMEQELQDTTGTKSQIIVLKTLGSIALGLANIHVHGIIYGYVQSLISINYKNTQNSPFSLSEIYIQIIFSSQRYSIQMAQLKTV